MEEKIMITQIIVGLFILAYGYTIFIKTNQGIPFSKAINPFYFVNHREDFISMLSQVLETPHESKNTLSHGFELAYIFNDNKYFYNENEEQIGDYETSPAPLLYLTKDSNGNELQYCVVKYNGEIYLHFTVIELFYKFDKNKLYNNKSLNTHITQLIPGFWNLSLVESRKIESTQKKLSDIELWWYGLNNNIRAKEIYDIGITKIKSKVI